MRIVPQAALLESYTPDPQRVIEAAGRTCYRSTPGFNTAGAFCKMLIARGHESVLEHAFATFRIVCDRGVSHELVRHRIASFSQESTRFCNYAKDHFGKELTFVEPPGLTGGARDEWLTAVSSAELRYLALIEMGQPPEIARSVLPTCLKTQLVMTANFREWRTVLRQRCSPKAHPQMREIARMLLDQLLVIAPDVFDDLK